MGVCNICGTTAIFTKNAAGQSTTTPNYAEVYLMFSDASIATHGICTACAKQLTDQKIAALAKLIGTTMADQLVGRGSKEQIDHFNTRTVVAYDMDRSACIAKYNKIMGTKYT